MWMCLWVSMATADSLEKVHGWTTDGLFVYEQKAYNVIPHEDFNEDVPYTTVWVTKATGESVTSFTLGTEGELGAVEQETFGVWLGNHPIVVSKPARTGPRGTRLEGRAPSGAWKSDAFVVDRNADVPEGSTYSIGLSGSGEGFWPQHQQTIQTTAFGGHTYQATAWFHPTQPWVALVIDHSDVQTMRGMLSGGLTVKIVPTQPLIAVLAPQRLAAAAQEAATSIEAQGTVTTGEAQKDRTATVIYFAEGFRDDAEAIAKTLGGTVEPLTWKAPQHIVVALGAP